jgi:hypothetical protein
MSITKLSPAGQWGTLTNDLTQVGTYLGGRRVITGMLTGPDGLLAAPPPAAVAEVADPRPEKK